MLIIALCCCTSCDDDTPPEVSSSRLVVEGWIADGEFPIVIVTSTVPISEIDMPLNSLEQYVAQWARVGVCCEGDTVFLTGLYNSNYFPPYIFTTSSMRGRSGKEYKLIVDWHGMHAEAVTTIPSVVPIDSIWSEPCPDYLLFRQPYIRFQDSPLQKDYYILFSYRQGEPRNPQLCMYGVCDDASLTDSVVVFPVRRGGIIYEEDFNTYYAVNDTVEISLAHVEGICYAFWQAFESRKRFTHSLLFNVSTPLNGNVQGAYGIWYGCGISRKIIYL